MGNLGQHTGTQKNGMPVFDHRLRVFEQASSLLPMVRRNADGVSRLFLQRNLQPH